MNGDVTLVSVYDRPRLQYLYDTIKCMWSTSTTLSGVRYWRRTTITCIRLILTSMPSWHYKVFVIENTTLSSVHDWRHNIIKYMWSTLTSMPSWHYQMYVIDKHNIIKCTRSLTYHYLVYTINLDFDVLVTWCLDHHNLETLLFTSSHISDHYNL